MSSIKISDLPEKPELGGTEEVLINDSGTSKKMSSQLLIDKVTAAETAQTAAETAQAAAESARQTAQSYSNSASTSATNAATSETNASTSETNAAASATSAAASYDSFDDRYLGAKSSAPTVDNDGDALTAGVLYYDTTSGDMNVYTGSAWEVAYVAGSSSGALLISNNLSDLNSASAARSNLGVSIGADVQAYSSVLDATTASFTTADETKLNGIETGADVTDTANVTSAGALMDSEVTNLAQVKAFDSSDYATAAQGTAADNALPTSGGTMTGKITLDGDPTSALHAATKEYVDTIAAAGIHYHDPVRVESPSNLNATYNNGTSGVGATLTNAGTNAAITIDGVTLSSADRVLVYNQTNAAHNGVYTVTTVGDGSTAWVLTRSTDTDNYGVSDPDALGEGDAFFVKEGNTGAGELYVMNTSGTITFGTTNITFTVIAETAIYSGGTDITVTGTTIDLNSSITADVTGTVSSLSNHDTDDLTEGATNKYATTANVTAAGALMDSEVTNLAQVKAFDSTDYATAAQGAKADSALQPTGDGSQLTGISTDVVDDTTPQLGGNLDLNSNDITGTGNLNITGNLTSTGPLNTGAGNITTTGTVNATTVDLGNWTVTESSGVLYFATGGTNKMKLDASGNLTVTGDITAFGTV